MLSAESGLSSIAFVQCSDSSSKRTFFAVGIASIIICHSIARVEFYSPIEICDSKIRFTFGTVSRTTIAIDEGIIRVEFYQLR